MEVHNVSEQGKMNTSSKTISCRAGLLPSLLGSQDSPNPARMYAQLRLNKTSCGRDRQQRGLSRRRHSCQHGLVRNSGPYTCSFNLIYHQLKPLGQMLSKNTLSWPHQWPAKGIEASFLKGQALLCSLPAGTIHLGILPAAK